MAAVMLVGNIVSSDMFILALRMTDVTVAIYLWREA